MALHSFCGGCYAITRKLQQYGRPYYPKHSPSLGCNFCLQIGLIERVDTIYKGTDFGEGFESGMGFEIKEVHISISAWVGLSVLIRQ